MDPSGLIRIPFIAAEYQPIIEIVSWGFRGYEVYSMYKESLTPDTRGKYFGGGGSTGTWNPYPFMRSRDQSDVTAVITDITNGTSLSHFSGDLSNLGRDLFDTTDWASSQSEAGDPDPFIDDIVEHAILDELLSPVGPSTAASGNTSGSNPCKR